MLRKSLLAMLTLSALAFAPSAGAAIPSVFNGDVSCSVAGDSHRFCGSTAPRSTTETFDGVPIDVNVAFPAEPASGPDGRYPLIMMFHGYSGSKFDHATMDRWLNQGYAVFTMTQRGMGQSCGMQDAVDADPAGCGGNKGYIHLMDSRYEVRDAQTLAGRLVDEGLVDPEKIGAWGGSYGGGMSIALATLNDRTMKPDGSFMDWKSPDGTPLHIAAAVPEVPWTDLAYSLAPNGGTLDYVVDSPYHGRFGVPKQSYILGLYLSRQSTGRYAPAGLVPEADLSGWKNLMEAGEPFDSNPAAGAMVTELTTYHSAYYLDNSTPPAPMLISSGWTDDLFPPDEAIRYYNRVKSSYPKQPISMFFLDAGHARGQNKPADNQLLADRVAAWFNHYLKGEGAKPFVGVETLTQTCPKTAPSAGPFYAASWARMAKGEIRATWRPEQRVRPFGGYPAAGNPFEPNFGGGACATVSGADGRGNATYRLAKAAGGGFTLMGSPTVIANFLLTDQNSQVAVRLLDVDPEGSATLVARGLWRPETGPKPKRQVFQLHPNGYHVAPGHVIKLELLPQDAMYGQKSKGQQDVAVSNLELRLPVLEKPGAAGGLVRSAAKPFLPAGAKLTRDVRNLPKPRVSVAGGPVRLKRHTLRVKVACPNAVAICLRGRIRIIGIPRKGRSGRGTVARGAFRIRGGNSKVLKLKLTPRARKHFRKRRSLPVKIAVRSSTTSATNVVRRVARR